MKEKIGSFNLHCLLAPLTSYLYLCLVTHVPYELCTFTCLRALRDSCFPVPFMPLCFYHQAPMYTRASHGYVLLYLKDRSNSATIQSPFHMHRNQFLDNLIRQIERSASPAAQINNLPKNIILVNDYHLVSVKHKYPQ